MCPLVGVSMPRPICSFSALYRAMDEFNKWRALPRFDGAQALHRKAVRTSGWLTESYLCGFFLRYCGFEAIFGENKKFNLALELDLSSRRRSHGHAKWKTSNFRFGAHSIEKQINII